LQLKAITAHLFLPGGDTPEHMKKNHEMRKQCLAHLDEVQTNLKKKKGGWWIIPNPFAVFEGVASIF
jgi:hypothetical protein